MHPNYFYCKHCPKPRKDHESFEALCEHVKTVHPGERMPYQTGARKLKAVVEPGTTVGKINEGRQIIAAAIRDADIERTVLMQKVKELDDLIGKYSKLV